MATQTSVRPCLLDWLRGPEKSSLFSFRNQGAMSHQGALEMPGLVEEQLAEKWQAVCPVSELSPWTCLGPQGLPHNACLFLKEAGKPSPLEAFGW